MYCVSLCTQKRASLLSAWILLGHLCCCYFCCSAIWVESSLVGRALVPRWANTVFEPPPPPSYLNQPSQWSNKQQSVRSQLSADVVRPNNFKYSYITWIHICHMRKARLQHNITNPQNFCFLRSNLYVFIASHRNGKTTNWNGIHPNTVEWRSYTFRPNTSGCPTLCCTTSKCLLYTNPTTPIQPYYTFFIVAFYTHTQTHGENWPIYYYILYTIYYTHEKLAAIQMNC